MYICYAPPLEYILLFRLVTDLLVNCHHFQGYLDENSKLSWSEYLAQFTRISITSLNKSFSVQNFAQFMSQRSHGCNLC